MSENTFPIYRKFLNGREFMKLNSDGKLIKVKLIRDNSWAIALTENSLMVADFHNTELSTESSRDEFEKAYGQAQYLLTKANCEQ